MNGRTSTSQLAFAFALALTLPFSLAPEPAKCQSSSSNATTPTSKNIKLNAAGRTVIRKKDDRSYETQPLGSAPQLPDVPAYTGKSQFSVGYMYPNSDGGPSYTVSMGAREKPEHVINWYKDSLRSYGWNFDPNNRDPHSLVAMHTKTNNYLKLVVISTGNTVFPTSVEILYKVNK